LHVKYRPVSLCPDIEIAARGLASPAALLEEAHTP